MYIFKLWLSPDTCSGVGLLGHMVVLLLSFFFFFFKESSLVFFIIVVLIYIPSQSIGGFLCLHSLFKQLMKLSVKKVTL